MFIEIDEVPSKLLSMIDDTIVPLLGENGKYVAKLDKALHGSIQSVKLWFDTLTNVLRRHGFTANRDGCVMNR